MNAADTEAPVQLDITGVRTLASTGTAVTLAADPQGHQLDRRAAGGRAGDIEGVTASGPVSRTRSRRTALSC